MSDKRKPTLVELASSSIDQVPWEPSRLPDSMVKALSLKDGVAFFAAKVEPGCQQPAQKDKYRQVRYVIEGEFIVNGTAHGPGTTIDIPQNTEYTVSSPAGGQWFILEIAGKSADAQPTDPRSKQAA